MSTWCGHQPQGTIMAIVYDEETIRRVKALVREMPGDSQGQIDYTKSEVLALLEEYGQDADSWASDVGYGYCDDCDGERFRDESRD